MAAMIYTGRKYKIHLVETESPVPKAYNFIKKRFWHRCFLVNFAKFLRTSFLTEHIRWLLLIVGRKFNKHIKKSWIERKWRKITNSESSKIEKCPSRAVLQKIVVSGFRVPWCDCSVTVVKIFEHRWGNSYLIRLKQMVEITLMKQIVQLTSGFLDVGPLMMRMKLLIVNKMAVFLLLIK